MVWTRLLKSQFFHLVAYLWKHKGLWLRAFLCILIGAAFMIADPDQDFDIRLFLRNSQKADSEIVIVNIERDRWQKLLQTKSNLGALKEIDYFSDSYYWNEQVWNKMLSMILKMEPAGVGVTLYFGTNINKENTLLSHSYPFNDRRVVWSTLLDREGRILPSRMAKSYSRNSGNTDFKTDRDGVVRRFDSTDLPVTPLAMQLYKLDANYKPSTIEKLYQNSELINFRGSHKTFKYIQADEIFSGQLPTNFFKDKMVIIGAHDRTSGEYLTPVGRLSRAELTGNILDNIRNHRWINKIKPLGSLIIIIVFVILTAFITSVYPQFLALFLLFWINALYATISLWIFDTFYYWIPILTPIVATAATYITYLSWQLSMKEYSNMQLEKERLFMMTVETLKNNFISLISHDLKTPIAKIQAICDRLLHENSNNNINKDINMLKGVAAELHRYIQTILQVAKVEAREFKLNIDSADINEITENVVTQLKPIAEEKQIDIQLNLEPMFLVEVDHVLIHEVILNVIENAIKYSPNNSAVKVSTREVDDQVFLVVEDQGPGVTASERARIFDKFYRGESGKAQQKGSGLGLYLVKYFIERHNGKVFFDSVEGAGSKVGFSLPINYEDTTEQATVNLVEAGIIMNGEKNVYPS
jgi:two-component system phosphate regulon sensor histidine kinase PhoR